MEQPKLLPPMAALLFITGVAVLFHFSSGIRPVAVVGLSGSGFAIGVGFAFPGFVFARSMKR